MVRRILFLVIVLILSLFVVKTPLYSQEPPSEIAKPTFDQIYTEYIGLIEEYNDAHDEYALRRSQYLKFESLKSRQDAFDATLLMLEKRDEVVISYFKVLEIKLEEGTGISDDRKDGLLLRINDERDWFTNHKDNLSTTGSLNDLVSDSKLAKSREVRIDPLAYEVMSVLSQGKITKFSERLDEVFDEIKTKLELIRNEQREEYSFSSLRFQTLDRWMFEADGKIVRSKEKQDEAELLISKIQKTRGSVKSYNQVVVKLKDAQLYMNEANSFLKEIIEQVKTAE